MKRLSISAIFGGLCLSLAGEMVLTPYDSKGEFHTPSDQSLCLLLDLGMSLNPLFCFLVCNLDAHLCKVL